MANNKKLGLPGGPNKIIVDPKGQWNHPGKNTRIESNHITMQDVPYPVWAQPNVGPGTMMMPGSEHHFKNADYVDEYPMAQDGTEIPIAKRGGGLLDKTMQCNSCGWEWKAADGGNDVSTCHKCGGSALPKAQDGDETSSDLEKEIDGLDLSKYNVRVIQYPYGSKKFSPGHIESVLIDKKTGRQVNKISDTKLVGYINRWAGPGNRRVTQRDYEREEDVRTVDLNLSESQIKNFITEAQLFTGTNKGKEHSKSGLNVRKLPLSINDDNIYDYDFVDSNCATGVCMGLGMDPNSPENTQAGITDPNLVMDGILSKYNDFIVPGSSTGYRTSREDGLKNLVKDNLGENVNAGTIDVLTNYLDGLNRDDINNTLESILQNPTALKILKDDGDLSKIGDRAIRDLTSIFNSYNPFVDVGRGREQMARKNIDNIKRDVVNIYESIPEGTIPAALEALNEQYIKPNNPFDVSLEGVKNIPGWWKNKLGFKEGGSLPQAQNGNFGGVNTDILDTSGEPVYETINPGDSNYDAKYRETYNAGAFAFAPNPLDEMVMYAGVDYEKYPYYNDLSKQDREYFKDDGPIGRGVRRRAQTKRGLAEDALDIPGQLLRGALETAQAPQAAMVEGIEALRGNNYNFSNALPGSGGQKLPSQAFGFEDKPGWDIGGSLNTAMDLVADPSNFVGVGLYDDIVKLGLKATPKLNSITKTFGKSLNKTDDFTSSINWGSWNKEIPTNKVLMKEYNAIEQAAKKNGTWMKYSDGSAFNGSPEQFVQMNSKNLYNFAGGKEAAEQMYKNPKFRGGHQHIDDFIHRDRNDWATFLTDNKKNAESYSTSDGTTKEFFNPAVNKPGEWVDGIYQLGFPTNLPTVTSNANGRSWRLLDYDDRIAQGLTNNRVDIHQKNLLNWSDGFLDDYNLQGYNPSNKYLSTDDYAAYVKNKANNEVVAKIKNVKDQMGTSTDIPSNTVYAVDAERVPLKSLLYNNGDFAMTNSNIYKAIVPGAIGAGAVSQMGPKQEDGQFQNGGSLPEAQGGWGGLFKAGLKQGAKYSDEIVSFLKNLYKLNPNRFKTNPDNFYHRSQNYKDNILGDQLVPWLQGNPELAAELTKKIPGKFNLFKTKSNYDELYWSKGTPLDGRYYTKQSYPGPYVWEMPSSMKSINKVNGKVKSFNDNLGSYKVNTEPLKVSDAKLYAEHWWKGYKQIDPLKKQEGGSLPQAQNAGEDVQDAQQDVQNRAVIFAEAPEYTTHQYNIDTPIYDSEGNLIANYPSELETLYNNYNQSEAGIEDINNKKIAEKKASSYLQFLIHEKDKMKRQHDAMYKEFEENGYYEGLENESRFLEYQEKYQNLGDQIGQFTKQIYKRERDIDKKYNSLLDQLYLKNSNAYTDFYNNERNSQIKNTDSTFYKEAQNLQRVYEKLQPNTNVEIVPIYRDPDTMREKVADLNKNDAMFLFGHSGSRLGGIPNTEIANIFQESKAENCYLGSCDFEENVEPYTNMVNKNLNYRPSGSWWGVNPNGSTIDEAMWSRVTDQNPGPTTGDMGTAKIITPTLGVDYQTKKLKKGGGIEKYTMYKDYVNGIYTGDKKESIAQKNYDRLNRLHYREAKTNQMTPANYILSYLME